MNKSQSASQRRASYPYLVWALIFIIVPLLMVIYYAFTDSQGGFTADNILKIGDYMDTFLLSILLGAIATVICLLISYPAAYMMSRMRFSRQKTMLMLVMLPMWINLLLRTYALMGLLEDTGLINRLLSFFHLPTVHMINTPGAVVLGMVYNFLPYMILPLYSIMTKVESNILEAAQDLGSNGFETFRRVIFPLSVPGIVSGITMVFVPSVSTFYISQKLGGTSTLIGDIIDTKFSYENNYNLGAALSFVLMIMIFICMAVMNEFSDDEGEAIIV